MTENIALNLTAEQRKWLRAQMKQGGFSQTADYLSDLLVREQLRQEHERIEGLLDEALVSGEPEPVTPETWRRIRAEVKRRVTRKARP